MIERNETSPKMSTNIMMEFTILMLYCLFVNHIKDFNELVAMKNNTIPEPTVSEFITGGEILHSFTALSVFWELISEGGARGSRP